MSAVTVLGQPRALTEVAEEGGNPRMTMRLRVEVEREEDGRWIAEVPEILGAMAYGASREAALAAVEALALRVLADRLEHGEGPTLPLSLSFVEEIARAEPRRAALAARGSLARVDAADLATRVATIRKS